MKKRNPYNWLRWTARISGSLIVVFTLFMFIGEFIEGQQKHAGLTLSTYTPIIWTMFIVWGIALAGLVLALWKEGPGGCISLVSYFLVYILNLFNKDASGQGNTITIFLIFSMPSILYLLYWKLIKDESLKADNIELENPDKA